MTESYKQSKLSFCNKLTVLLTICLFSSFVFFTNSSYGSIILAVILGLMLAVNILMNNRRNLYFGVNAYHGFALLFVFFTFASAIWSVNAGNTITKSITLFELFISMSVVMICYQRMPNKTKLLLQVIRWSGIIVALYSIAYYGLGNILYLLRNAERMDNEYANINTIGMLAAYSIIIWFGLAFADRSEGRRMIHFDSLFNIPCILIVAGSGSRKSLLIVALGIFLNLIFFNIGNKGFFKIIGKVFIAGAVVYVLILILKNMNIFKSTFDRMNGLFGALFGTGEAESSALKRVAMIELGLEQFKKTPIRGIGIDSARFLTISGTYLHNNYVEILAGGGIIGFICYYSKYIYLLIGYWLNRKFWNAETAVVFSFLLIVLIMDYGNVSYYTKENSFYLMMFFIELKSFISDNKHINRTNLGRYKEWTD